MAVVPVAALTHGLAAAAHVLHPLQDPRWLALVEGAPAASMFHHPDWLGLLRDVYGFPIIACCVLDGEAEIAAGLPLALVSSRLTGRRLVALPFSDVCAPLGRDDEAERSLGGALAELQQQMGIPLHVHAPLDGQGTASDAFLHHVVDLEPGLDLVTRAFARSSVLQGVRRARRMGVVIERRRDTAALQAFYRLHAGTRRRQGVPTQPRKFILAFERLFERDHGFVSLASVEGRPIAAAVFLAHNGVLTYKYGASDRRYLDRRPNNLLFLDAIEWARERRMHTLDLGRTDAGHESLRAFKLGFGAQEHELRYTSLGDKGSVRSRETPAALRSLIRNAPALVGRAVGAALYRHVG